MNKFFFVVAAPTMGAEALTAVYDLRWMMVFIVWLILADFWFGVSASRKRGEAFCLARAGRRTCNKLVDYIAYLLSGAMLGLAVFEPLGIAGHIATAAAGLALGCVWEAESIVDHVCELHGVKRRFSLWRLLLRLLKSRFGG